ncbi:MAG TPA: CRTAC1 family protein, partial [Candidatus Limnocylindrales bacterium]|nr:CRTAC1 family protein [Candidatus Limnocylindrales bacterium]
SWLPVMAKMPQRKDRSDPQIIANVLQVRDAADVYRDEATPRGVSASGWAWSGKFGDLDADGFLDLYVVNGMIDGQTLGHLPGHELVEENQAYRNQGDGTFAPARRWGLGARESGRGLAIGDLDDDGDLDVVVNNLAANARLFENRLCGGAHLQVDLRWPGSSNSHALGARLALVTEAGTYRRDVVAGSGYLSGDPSRQHFGVPAGATPVRLEVVWPDGARSTVERPALSTRLVVTRTEEGR